MPLQLGRNPKSYPPNDAYRDNWDRIFGKGKKPEKEATGAAVIEHLTRATRERYCDDKPTGTKAFIINDGRAPKIFEDISRERKP